MATTQTIEDEVRQYLVLAGMKTRGSTVKEFGAAGVRSGRAIGWVVKGSVAVGGLFLA